MGVGQTNVVSILDMTRVCLERRISLCNVNRGSGGEKCVGEAAVYVTIQEGPYAMHRIQICVEKKAIEMKAAVMRELLGGGRLTRVQRHLHGLEGVRASFNYQQGGGCDGRDTWFARRCPGRTIFYRRRFLLYLRCKSELSLNIFEVCC